MTSSMKPVSDDMMLSLGKQTSLPDDVIIIDIREPSEYRVEHIAGSRNIPLGLLGKTDFSAERNKTAIFHCRVGNRTQTGQAAILATGFKEIYCITGGLEQWKQLSLPVIRDQSAPIDIMRQVQITVGSLLSISLLLTQFVSPYFMWLTAFFACGLIFAGVSGTCAMAKMLMIFPWNRSPSTPPSSCCK